MIFRYYFFSENLLKLTSVKKSKNKNDDIMQQEVAVLFRETLQMLVLRGDII